MPTLSEKLLRQDNFPQVVADCKTLIEQELDSKGGVSGGALKLAYKAVTSFAPGYYDTAVTNMVPSFVQQLDPFWAHFVNSGGSSFGDYLAKNGEQASEALLAVTDQLAGSSSKGAVVRAYKTVRGGASKHIEAALPNLGELVQRYMARP
jgi:hypothetical protein